MNVSLDKQTFDRVYARVTPEIRESLWRFRRNLPLQRWSVDGVPWEYLITGKGRQTILFLHGLAGAYDVWWQQIRILQDEFRMMTLTYPPVFPLAALERGIMHLLDRHRLERVLMVGTSMGGYLAQYLMARRPERFLKVVLSNTFPPNPYIARKNRFTGLLLSVLPEGLIWRRFRTHTRKMIYPASGGHELTLAYLNEMSRGRMRRTHLIARFRCIVEPFEAPFPAVPILILESENDPLVEPRLRGMLRRRYAGAYVYTFPDAGHFPYLNRPREYAVCLKRFFTEDRHVSRKWERV